MSNLRIRGWPRQLLQSVVTRSSVRSCSHLVLSSTRNQVTTITLNDPGGLTVLSQDEIKARLLQANTMPGANPSVIRWSLSLPEQPLMLIRRWVMSFISVTLYDIYQIMRCPYNVYILTQVVIYTGTDPYFCSGGSLSELFSSFSSPKWVLLSGRLVIRLLV